MTFRFKKSFKIAPGVKLNIGKSGIGVSTGIRGARIGINKKGAYTSVGVPGTGISSISYFPNNKDKKDTDLPIDNNITNPIIKNNLYLILSVIFIIFLFIQPLVSILILVIMSISFFKKKN